MGFPATICFVALHNQIYYNTITAEKTLANTCRLSIVENPESVVFPSSSRRNVPAQMFAKNMQFKCGINLARRRMCPLRGTISIFHEKPWLPNDSRMQMKSGAHHSPRTYHCNNVCRSSRNVHFQRDVFISPNSAPHNAPFSVF